MTKSPWISIIKLTYIDNLYIIYIGHLYMEGVKALTVNKNLITGSTTMLILKLLEEKDMYGYMMIEELAKRSDNTFSLKAGTLYPLLHGLEEQGMINSYDQVADNTRTRKYYSITKTGRKLLQEQKEGWEIYSSAVDRILEGGANFETI